MWAYILNICLVVGKLGREHQSAHEGALSRTQASSHHCCQRSTSQLGGNPEPGELGQMEAWVGDHRVLGSQKDLPSLHGLWNPVFTAHYGFSRKQTEILWGRSSKSSRWAHTFLQSLNHSGGQTTLWASLPSPIMALQTSSPLREKATFSGALRYAAGTQNSGSQPGARHLLIGGDFLYLIWSSEEILQATGENEKSFSPSV